MRNFYRRIVGGIHNILMLALFLLSSVSYAFSLDLTREHLAAFSPLFAGYTAGAFCDKLIDTNAATRYLVGKLGKDTNFSVQQAAEIAWMVVGQQSMQASMGVLPKTASERAKYCQTMMSAFGPTGTEIPGILKP